MSDKKAVSNNNHPDKPFDKLAAIMEAVYKTRRPGDDKEALKAILDSMKKPNASRGE